MKRSHSFEFDDPVEKVLNTTPAEETAARARLSTLTVPVSPPRKRSAVSRDAENDSKNDRDNTSSVSLAAVEAGQAKVEDPVKLFSTRLAQVSRPKNASDESPRLSVKDWINLYSKNQHVDGHHFVIHQHDHPLAGTHYDLRLQFSESSSLSWSIMYGLPGDPNSRRINRNATETRVHCLWNHLIETGSAHSGSMIIWDTGEYEILPYYPDRKPPETDESASDVSHGSPDAKIHQLSESEKLREAFQNRKIRLRLHGTRLPKNYTISLRLSVEDDNAARARPISKRRRRRRAVPSHEKATRTPSTSRSPSPTTRATQTPFKSSISTPDQTYEEDINEGHSASASDSESVDAKTRLTNAYPGAVNSVGSIHQRRWFVTLDRQNSGFFKDNKDKIWKRKGSTADYLPGFEPFYVRGPEIERSVVTGRTGYDVLEDENVNDFIPRRGWRPILN